MAFRFIPELVCVGVEARDCEEAIKEVAGCLVSGGYVGPGYPDLVCKRERAYPTGLPTRGCPVALSHADGEGTINGNHIAVGVMKDPVGFLSMENADVELPVRIVFVLAMRSAHVHLEMLQVLMRLLHDEGLLKSVVAGVTPEQICEVLNRNLEEESGRQGLQ